MPTWKGEDHRWTPHTPRYEPLRIEAQPQGEGRLYEWTGLHLGHWELSSVIKLSRRFLAHPQLEA